jgi:copper(I)-binding protein
VQITIPRVAGLILVGIAMPAAALAQVRVENAWVRATVPSQKATGAFMKLTAAANASLVGVASPAAPLVELHESSMQGGVMQMRAVPRIVLPANKSVELKPGGYHVMLMGVTTPLNAGGTVPLTLTFEDAAGKRTSVDVSATVRPLTSMPDKHGH